MISTFKTFSKEELRAIFALSTGTLLEYFDFFLYIHLASTLNQIFFDVTKEKSQLLLTSLAYVMPLIFRPFGALILGYIGDKIGRVYTIYITLVMMSISSIGIFLLPTYAQIGVLASVLISAFRIIQSVSSMGEIVGAKLYLNEYLSGKKSVLALSFVMLGCFWGGQLALHAIQAASFFQINFRYLFLIGLVIFFVGFYSRATLRESLAFVQAKHKKKEDKKISKMLIFANLGLECVQTSGWFFCYVYLNSILRKDFGYTADDMIHHNVLIGFSFLVTIVLYIALCTKVYVLKITKVKNFCLLIMYLISPLLLRNLSEAWHIVVYEILLLACISDPTFNAVVYKNLPVLKRSLVGTMAWALPRAVVGLIMTFLPSLIEAYLASYTFAFICGSFALYALVSAFILENIDRKNSEGFYKNYI